MPRNARAVRVLPPYVAPPGYVYFVYCEANHQMRIGWSKAGPNKRFTITNMYSPHPVARFALMHGPRRLEAEIHERFERHWVKGEWFRVCDEILEFIRVNARDWFDLFDEDCKRAMASFCVGGKTLGIRMAERVAPQASDEDAKKMIVGRGRGRPPKGPELKSDRPKRYGPLQALLDAAREETP